MISRCIVGVDAFRRCVVLIAFVLAVLAQGCGSQGTNPPGGTETGTNRFAQLKAEDMYRWEGKGKDKRKVTISRRERDKLLEKAAKKNE